MDRMTSWLDAVGMALVTAGVLAVSVPAGLVVAGLAVLVTSWRVTQ